MQTTFEEDLFEEGSEEDGFAADGFEGDALEDAFEGEDLGDALDEGAEMEEGFDAEAFEGEAFEEDAFEADGFEESDGFEADAIEDGFDVEDAFASAMDAEDEDEFLRRVARALRRVSQNPIVRRVARRALPIGARLVRQFGNQLPGAFRDLGGIVGQELRGVIPGLGGAQADAMDAFAEAAAGEALTEDAMDEFAPVLGGIAARYVVRRTTTPAARAARPAAARNLGRAVARATSRASRTLARTAGPGAVRAVPRIVRRVTQAARTQGVSPRAVPRLITRAAARVARSPRAAARLSARGPVARRAAGTCACGGLGGRGMRSFVVRRPVRITIRRV